MEKALLFERSFVLVVADMLTEQGIKHSPFARHVFGEKSGVRLWRLIRQGEKTRAVAIHEAYLMAEFFKMDFPSFIWQVSERIKALKQNLL